MSLKIKKRFKNLGKVFTIALFFTIPLFFPNTSPASIDDPCSEMGIGCSRGARVCIYVVEHGFCYMPRSDD